MYDSKGRVLQAGILPLLFPAIVRQKELVHSLHTLGSRKLLLHLEVGHRQAVHRSIQLLLRHYPQIQRQGRHRTEQLIQLDLDLDRPGHSGTKTQNIRKYSGNTNQLLVNFHRPDF